MNLDDFGPGQRRDPAEFGRICDCIQDLQNDDLRELSLSFHRAHRSGSDEDMAALGRKFSQVLWRYAVDEARWEVW